MCQFDSYKKINCHLSELFGFSTAFILETAVLIRLIEELIFWGQKYIFNLLILNSESILNITREIKFYFCFRSDKIYHSDLKHNCFLFNLFF